jgi:repressor LexA
MFKMTKTPALPAKQERILAFVTRFWQDRGYPPSVRDIVGGCELSSTSVAAYNLKILQDKGLLNRQAGVSRGIERPADAEASVPLIGTIAAGQPIPVPDEETWDPAARAERIPVPAGMLKGKQDVYALRVRGNSMIDALINDGDVVLLQYTNAVDNGEMAAVWLKSEKEATLKKFYAEKGRVRLQPANSTMQPFYADARNVAVQGRVVGVLRQI